MKLVTLISILSVVLISAASVEAITIFDSNATIGPGDVYDTVVVKGDGTVVDMNGGDIDYLIAMNASTFNMSAGNINVRVRSYDSSVLNLAGSSSVDRIQTLGESVVNVSGSTTVSGATELTNSSTVNISSAGATTGSIYLYNESATLNVTAGNITKIGQHHSYGGTINLSGGTIGRIGVDDTAQCVINVIGYDLEAVPYDEVGGAGQVTGYWNNDSAFTIPFDQTSLGETYPYLVLYDGVIPPNCTAKPASDISGDCKVNFEDLAKLSSEWLKCGIEPNEACWQ